MAGSIIAAAGAWAQPSNDSCETPLPVPAIGGTLVVDLNGATPDEPGPSCLPGYRTVWFSYTAPASGRIDVSTCGSETYAAIAIFDTCDHEVECSFHNDDCPGDGQGIIHEYGVTAGQTVLIAVTDTGMYTGRTFLNVIPQVGPPPANDECVNATEAVNGAYAVDNRTATGEATFPCQNPRMQPRSDVWYRYTSPVTGLAQAEFEGGTLRWVLMDVLDGCGGNSLACHDGSYGASRVVWNATAGQSYLVRVSGLQRGNPNYGEGTIHFSNPQPPANDRCENAQAVTLGYSTYNNAYASTDWSSPSCVGADKADVFFSFSPQTTMYVYASSGYGSPMDSAVPDSMALYDGCGGPMLQCDNVDVNVLPSFQFLAEAGHTYILRIASTYQLGTGGLLLNQIAMPAVNDECAGAIAVGEGETSFDTTRFVAGAYTSSDPLYCFGDPFPGGAESLFNNDLWYAFTPDRDANYSLRVIDGNFVAEVYQGCGGAAVGCTYDFSIESDGYSSRSGCFDGYAGQTYMIRVGQDFFTGGGAASFLIEEIVPQPFAIPEDAIAENEACGAVDANGGCLTNTENPVTEAMTVCTAVTGTLGVDWESGGYPDIDAYTVQLQGGVEYVFEGQSEIRAMTWVSKRENCWERDVLIIGHVDGNCRHSFSERFVAPETGSYEMLVQLENGESDCVNIPNRYWVRISPAAGCGCPADFNHDDFLDFFDYADFVACFEGDSCPNGDPFAADFNRDQFVDFFDYSDFVTAFETGC